MPHIYIREDGLVHIPRLEVYPVTGCNLRCSQCAILSPYRNRIIPVEEFFEHHPAWREKIKTPIFAFIGGEIFLHPDVTALTAGGRRIWFDSEIQIVSNGLLIPTLPDEVFEALRTYNIKVIISDHGIDLEKVYECLEARDIWYEKRPSCSHWKPRYRIIDGKPTAFKNDPVIAREHCIAPYECYTLSKGKLYFCSILASVIDGIEEGALNVSDWSEVLSYRPLTLEDSAETIVAHLEPRPIPECTICPDNADFVENTQLI